MDMPSDLRFQVRLDLPETLRSPPAERRAPPCSHTVFGRLKPQSPPPFSSCNLREIWLLATGRRTITHLSHQNLFCHCSKCVEALSSPSADSPNGLYAKAGRGG